MSDSTVKLERLVKRHIPSEMWLELPGNTILALSGLALTYYLYYLHPVGYVYFVTEDYWVEWATFVSLVMGVCFIVWALFNDHGLRKPGFFLFALGMFLDAMEEISWGQRIFHFRSPQFFAAHNLQGEVNIHNFIFPSYRIIGVAVFLWAILLPLALKRSMRLRRWCGQIGIPIAPVHVWPFFLLAVYFYDLSPLPRGKQIAEAYLGIGIAALSLDLALTTKRGPRARGITDAGAAASMIVAVGIITALLVQFYPAPMQLKINLNQFAKARLPTRGLYRQAETIFAYMDRNPQYLLPETRFQHGLLLKRMGRHAEAREILDRVLAQQEQRQQQHPDDPDPYRFAGKVLMVLGRKQEAERAFQEALGKDRSRFERASDRATEAWIHLSQAETLCAMGDTEAASRQFSIASTLTEDYEYRYLIELRIGSLERRECGPRAAVKRHVAEE